MARHKFTSEEGARGREAAGDRQGNIRKARRETAGTQSGGETAGAQGGGEATRTQDRTQGGESGGARGSEERSGTPTGTEEVRPAGEATPRVEEPTPGEVSWGKVIGTTEGPMPTKMWVALAQLFDFAYRVPALAGLGDHWPLIAPEAKSLGMAAEACLKSIPQKNRSAAVKAVSRWLPWISLTTTAYIITMPRIMTTRLSQIGRGASREQAEGPVPGVRGDGRGVAYEVPGFPGRRVASWADFGSAVRRTGG